MTSYLIRRIVALIPVLIGITVISFGVMHLAPGRPTDAATDLNVKVSLEARERLNQLYGLNDPLPVQYGRWVGRLARGDFGASFHDGRPVLAKIAERVPITLGINLCALLLTLAVAVPLGLATAARAGSRLDRGVTTLLLIVFSAPSFWLALLALGFFGVELRWVPVSGLQTLLADRWPLWRQWLDLGRHLILPVTILALGDLVIYTRYLRGNLVEVLQQDYIRTARAHGLPPRRVLYRHALRNALLPFITMLGFALPGLLGGSVILESLFGIPGLGRLFYDGVMGRDYPVIMGLVVLGAVLTLAGNLLADLAYAVADPRIRYNER
ncbi:MAG: diguanylate cyclase [Omnitrophica bacterium RIFCSPHIGHO2_02_FULL_63_14]|nr:MAG: diguanylate cyclase [Omnitrophica bacterium RIFCSPHIGHO2_02_FULL_63_14]